MTKLPTQRLPDWQTRLAALMASRRTTPFAWGGQDCCLFAADAVLAVTGHDPAADLRGTYTTATDALRVLNKAGGVAGVAIKRAGPVVAVALAQPGDIGLLKLDVPNPLAATALAVYGGSCWHAPGEHGLTSYPESAIVRAWRCTGTEPCPKL